MLVDLAIIVVLVLLNGCLAMSELAIVSSRPARLQILADKGSSGAATALKLAENPGRFLSTVQIGITLVGIVAGAFSGATIGTRVASSLAEAGMVSAYAEAIGVGLVVIAITYLSLILGELVPKRIALRAPERIAAAVAPLMQRAARIAGPLVWLLDRSSHAVVTLLGASGGSDARISEEELKMMIVEAETAGILKADEREMIAGVMRLSDRTASGMMTHRREVEFLDLTERRDHILEQLRRTTRSRLPVHEGSSDEIIGILVVREALSATLADPNFAVRALLREAPVVIDTLSAPDVIERLRLSPAHMVLVYDEYGHFEGLITPMDILGTVTGSFEAEDEPRLVARDDGSLLVSGSMPVDEFADEVGIAIDTRRDYDTVAGLLLDRLGHIPKVGETLSIGQVKVEVVDMDGRRIDKVIVHVG